MRNKKALLLIGTLALLFPSAIGTFALIKYANSFKVNPNQIEDKTPSFNEKEQPKKEAEPTTSNENSTPSNVENTDNAPKELSKEEKELELAPNLIPFVKKNYSDNISNININAITDKIILLNSNDNLEDDINTDNWTDFEKQYINLQKDIENFFKEELKYRYKLANFSFDVIEDRSDYIEGGVGNTVYTIVSPKVEESRLNEKQMLYHKFYQTFKNLYTTGEYNANTTRSEFLIFSEMLTENLISPINDKIIEFNKTYPNFQFINLKPKIEYRIENYSNNSGKQWIKPLINLTINITYQNDKLPEILNLPLDFEIDIETDIKNSIENESYRITYINNKKMERQSRNSNARWETERFETYQEWKEFMYNETNRENYWLDTQWRLRNTIFIFDGSTLTNTAMFKSENDLMKNENNVAKDANNPYVEVKDVY